MIEFRVVTARQGRDGQPDRAVVCADYALGWVVDELAKTHRLVRWLPVEAHWSASIIPSREGADWDQKTEA